MASPTTRTIPSFDPFSIKEQLIDLAEDYFNLDNIDMYESGFMGYVVQALTAVTSDMLYQNAFAYNEAFLGRALLKSSVTNIANELDYKILSATPASGSLTLIVPVTMNRNTSIKLAAGSAVRAGSIPYKVYNTYYIRGDSAGLHITSYNVDTGLVEEIPYSIELHDGNTCVVFDIEIWQVAIYTYDFTFDNPTLYNFYTESISGYEGYLYDTIVTVDDERYTQVDSLYGSSDSDRHYEVKFVNSSDNDTSKLSVKFGNGVYGFQPKNGAQGLITLYTTLGKDGNIASSTAQLDVELVDTINAGEGTLGGVSSNNNLAITNGEDEESLEEIKQHTKENVSAAKRLVTETDYNGYAGVTSLTNIVAYPLLDRRNINGNEITIYNTLFDDDGYVIPTASIYTPMNESLKSIDKGEEIIGTDGITYVSPFELTYYNAYDVPYVKYTYSLSSTSVAPVLFFDNSPEDVEMSLTSYQAKFYENEGHVVHIVEIYKLATMDAGCISAKLYLGDNYQFEYNLVFATEYNDGTVINMSSDYVDYDNYQTGDMPWKVELYYSYPDDPETILYNTYYGTINLLSTGILVDTDQEFDLTSTSPESYFSIPRAQYSMTTATSNKAAFSLPMAVLVTTDPDGDDMTYKNVTATCTFNNQEYAMQLYSLNSDQTVYTFKTSYINLNDVGIGPYDVTFDISYSTNDGTVVYTNQYTGSLTIFESGKSVIQEIKTVSPTDQDEPKIEMIHIGVTSIDIDMTESTTDDNAYVFTLTLSKLHSNAASNIGVTMTIGSSTYDYNEGDSYVMEYGGELKIAETDSEIANSTVVIFTSPQIPVSEIPSGEVSFKIEVTYNDETIVIYKQYATFKQDISRIMKSDIFEFDDGVTYACCIPVIEKSYYEDNLKYLDSAILSKFTTLSNTFNQWGMLTDRINMKFVRTCGKSVNMRLNSLMESTVKSYSDDFSIDLPIPIHVQVYITNNTNINTSNLETEAKNIIYTFLTLKSGFHANIYRSEILRYLHDALPDILFAHVVEPTDEIIYDFDISKVPMLDRETLFTYCPEYIWFDKDKITVDIILMASQ